MGGVTLLMDEKEFFKDLIAAVDPNSSFEIFVMENDGTIVYDSNISQIGENTFESPLFQDYPEILDLGQKMGNPHRAMESMNIIIQTECLSGRRQFGTL